MPPYLNSATAIRRGLAILFGVCSLALAARYRLSGNCWILLFAVATGVFCARTHLWCWALPVVLVIGDLYPWTGSLFVNESDLFLSATLAVLLWRTSIDASFMRKHRWFLILWLPLAISVSLSLLRGWHGLQPLLSGDEFGLYGSQWNSLRVAKGFVWGILLAPFLIAEIERQPQQFSYFTKGMQASAFVVAVAVLYERAVSVGLFNFQQLYRATGQFFSMHTGGQHIDAFWAMLFPFVFLPQHRKHSWLNRMVWIVVLVISYYAIAATMSRAIICWTGLVTIALVLQILLDGASKPTLLQTFVYAVLAVAISGAGAVAILQSDPIRARFIESRNDLNSRWQQWSALEDAAEHGWVARVFGNGLGAIPSIASIAYDHPLRPAELVPLENDRRALRIRPGKAVYVEQLVDGQAPGPWTLQGLMRHNGPAILHAHVCEKTLFDSFRCIETSFKIQGRENSWQPILWSIDIGTLPSAADSSWLSCPVTLAFSASGENGSVDITNLRLQDAAGGNLLRNSDFQARSARWFFTSDDHASWRAENVWIHLHLEQGWLGVLSFAWLVVGTMAWLSRQWVASRERSVSVLLIAIVGFLAIGTFGSLLDTPWIVQLLCALLAVSWTQVRGMSQQASDRR